MRRSALAAAVTAAVVLGPVAPALAHPSTPLDPTLPLDATHAATDNVEYLGRFPEHAGTAGGRLSQDGTLFYLTDPRGVYVYDVTEPADPELLGSLPLVQGETGVALAQEDPDTDGTVLLVDGAGARTGLNELHVVDVSDPRALKVASTVPVKDHTWTCVTGTDVNGEERGCAYAYGRSGHIIDLRDPANPVNLPDTWRKAVEYGDRSNTPYTHDLTEIRPGLVMSAGRDAILMDTTDPAFPVRLAAVEQPGRFSKFGYHSVEWANGGRDPYVLLGTELAPTAAPGLPDAAGSDCQGENSVIETWDASAVVAALEEYESAETVEERDASVFEGVEFTRVDAFDATGRGIFRDGKAAAHELYCAHWMELAPGFDGEGRMAVAYYNRGTRFVDVAADGTMAEFGWITPAEGYAGSPQWITEDVVYIMDYRRGLELVRIKDEPATGVVERSPSLVSPASALQVPPVHLHGKPVTLGGIALLLALTAAAGRVVRRRAAVRTA